MNCNVAGCHQAISYTYCAEEVLDNEEEEGRRRVVEQGAFCTIEHAPAFLFTSRDLLRLPSFTRLEYELRGALIGCTHGIIRVEKSV